MNIPKQAQILLADGTTFQGRVFGAEGTRTGEFVFHTGMTGYQEILSDPSYCGQIVVMTYPEIGNTGITPEDMESNQVWVNGFVVRNLAPRVSNWRSTQDLDSFLAENNVIGIQGVDTRALTRKLRDEGAMMGVISSELSLTEMQELLNTTPRIEEQDLVDHVSTNQPYQWNEGTWKLGQGFRKNDNAKFNIVAYDFGIKKNILRLLADAGCNIEVVPSTTPAEEVLAKNPDGVFLSNGPGDPRRRPDIAKNVQGLLGKTPLFGICFGCQILGASLGADIEKLQFGHHAANHPVKHDKVDNVWITSQNHNYIVDAATLPAGVKVIDQNLNDETLEGFYDNEQQIFAIQYHPEASPGPHDAQGLFGHFIEMMEKNQ